MRSRHGDLELSIGNSLSYSQYQQKLDEPQPRPGRLAGSILVEQPDLAEGGLGVEDRREDAKMVLYRVGQVYRVVLRGDFVDCVLSVDWQGSPLEVERGELPRVGWYYGVGEVATNLGEDQAAEGPG